MSANDRLAVSNQEILNRAGPRTHFMASRGFGKTSFNRSNYKQLTDKLRLAVIDGDIATSYDADRAAAAAPTLFKSIPAVNVISMPACSVQFYPTSI
jgi:hydrogenase nickel incorporation protein HypB